jgi:hypothetical protein
MNNRVMQLEKGQITTAHATGTAATATSNIIRTKGNNAVLVKVDISGSGAWTIALTGALEDTGAFASLYDANGNAMGTGSKTTSGCYLFVGVPELIKIVATEDSGTATVTVKVQPITV